MITVDQIQTRLQQMMEGGISVDAFDEWFTQASWNMHKDSTQSALKLAGQIELLLAEYDGGHRSEKELLKEFQDITVLQPVTQAA